jgi:hypothetical protein
MVPLYIFIQPLVVLIIIKPAAGVAMALRSAVVILGGKNPCVVEDTSSFADGAGVAIPIPTCAKIEKDETINTAKSRILVAIDTRADDTEVETLIVIFFYF